MNINEHDKGFIRIINILANKAADALKFIFHNNLKAIVLSLFVILLMSLLSLTAYIKYCELRNKDVRFFRRFSIVRKIYTDRDFVEFQKIIVKESLDFDYRVTYMDKDTFNVTNMNGENMFKYKPNLKIMNISVWTGLSVAKLTFLFDPRIERILKRVKVISTDLTFETDKFGFKKTDFPNEEGSRAVIFIGDSFTEGLFTPSSKTFSNIFGIMMQRNGFQAIPVNMGVNGHSAVEMAWMLENYSKYFDVKMAIVNSFPNDVYPNHIAVITGEYSEKKSYEKMFKYLKKIKSYCVSNNIRLVISVIPPKEQLTKIPIEGLFQKRVSEWCNIEKVIFLNPLEYFRKIGEGNIYLSWDPHFSESGHEHYAHFLFNNLEKEMKEILYYHVKAKNQSQDSDPLSFRMK